MKTVRREPETKQPVGEPTAERLPTLGIVLKLLSCAAISCGACPVFAVLLTLLGIRPAPGSWYLGVAAMVSCLVGCGGALLLDRTRLSQFWQVILLCTGGGAVFLSAALFCAPVFVSSVFAQVFIGAAVAVMYVSGCRFSQRAPGVFDFLSVAAAFLLSATALSLLKAEYPLSAYFWMLFGASAILAVERNYHSIDYLMRRSGHGASRLPPRIRLHNLGLLTLLAVLVVLLVVFRQSFLAAADVLWQVLLAIIQVLLWLISRLFRSSGGSDDSGAQNPPTPEPGGSGGGNNLLFYVFVGIMALVLFFYLGKPILRAIRDKLLALLAAIRRALARFRVFRLLSPDSNEFYSDREERVTERGEPLPEPGTGRDLRRWRRDCRRFQRLPEGKEKFLFGYRLSREGLRLHNVELPPSATPLEVLERSRRTLSGPAFDTATWCLNAMEYSAKVTKPATGEIAETLTELKKR